LRLLNGDLLGLAQIDYSGRQYLSYVRMGHHTRKRVRNMGEPTQKPATKPK
jgi:hypothetical protein